MHYQHDMDVTDEVMRRIANKPVAIERRSNWLRTTGYALAASLALVLATRFTVIYAKDYDEARIGSDIVSIYNYPSEYNDNDSPFGNDPMQNILA